MEVIYQEDSVNTLTENCAESYPGDQEQRTVPTHEQISTLAHRLWEERGQPDGDAEQDWYEAERTLKYE